MNIFKIFFRSEFKKLEAMEKFLMELQDEARKEQNHKLRAKINSFLLDN